MPFFLLSGEYVRYKRTEKGRIGCRHSLVRSTHCFVRLIWRVFGFYLSLFYLSEAGKGWGGLFHSFKVKFLQVFHSVFVRTLLMIKLFKLCLIGFKFELRWNVIYLNVCSIVRQSYYKLEWSQFYIKESLWVMNVLHKLLLISEKSSQIIWKNLLIDQVDHIEWSQVYYYWISFPLWVFGFQPPTKVKIWWNASNGQ